MSGRFDLDSFVVGCQQALRDADPRGAMRELVTGAIRLGPAMAEDIPAQVRQVGGRSTTRRS